MNVGIGGPSVRDAMKMVEWAKALERDDIKLLKMMFTEMVQVFGLPSKQMPYYKGSTLFAIADIWLKNCRRVPPGEINHRLKRLVNHGKVIECSMKAGRIDCQFARNDFLAILNDKRSKYQFL